MSIYTVIRKADLELNNRCPLVNCDITLEIEDPQVEDDTQPGDCGSHVITKISYNGTDISKKFNFKSRDMIELSNELFKEQQDEYKIDSDHSHGY